MTRTEEFADFVGRARARRAEIVRARVTWRRGLVGLDRVVYSGYGSGGRLCWVEPIPDGRYEYGIRSADRADRIVVGTRDSLRAAKAAAAGALFTAAVTPEEGT